MRRRRLDANGFIINAVQPDVIRLAPPLILTADQADAFVTALGAALDRAAPDTPSRPAQPPIVA